MATLPIDQLLQENEYLRRRLEQAESLLAGYRGGDIGQGLDRAVRQGEARFRAVIDALPAAIYTTDAVGRITHFNPACIRLSGRKPELGIDHWCITWKLYYPDGSPMPHEECPMALALRYGRTDLGGSEGIAERPDGSRIWFEAYPTPLFDERGNVVGGINMLVDITERRQADRNSALLAAIVDSSDDAIISKDLSGIITSWNRGAERLFGYTAEETIGRSVTMLIPPDRRNEELEILARLKRGERVDHFDTVRICKDGTPLAISLTVSPVRDRQGRIIGASKIARDITTRQAVESALMEANRRKDEFLAILAHELRNPLAPIRNALQILKAKGPDEPELVWSRGVLDRQLRLMARLLDDLLDVSRIGRNKLELRTERIALAQVIDAALETSRPKIEAARHTLTVHLPPEPIYLNADLFRLAQVFANLLNNAAKYTEPGGRIELTAGCQGDTAVVSVRDSGIGLAPEVLPGLFDIFSQAEPALQRSQGGLGIGLSLARGLVELHGGTIEAHSDGPGCGSEFIVRLPVAAGKPAAAAPVSPAEEEMPPTSCSILVVDDNRDSADSLAMLLEIMGNQVCTAYDGEQAIQLAERQRPDVVLLDIGMPKVNGFEVCRRIREQSWGRDVYMIALTGWGQDEDRRRSEEAGFDQHLIKPVDLTVLMKVLPARTACAEAAHR